MHGLTAMKVGSRQGELGVGVGVGCVRVGGYGCGCYSRCLSASLFPLCSSFYWVCSSKELVMLRDVSSASRACKRIISFATAALSVLITMSERGGGRGWGVNLKDLMWCYQVRNCLLIRNKSRCGAVSILHCFTKNKKEYIFL